MHVFAMVTTRHSNVYTDYALSSLMRHTAFEPDDEVIVIDNDQAYGELPVECRGRVQVKINERPRSFAANVNQMIEHATERQADVIFLNNDLIFSPNWFEPLRLSGPFLLSPLSQTEACYDEGNFHCGHGVDLPDYLGKENAFLEIVRRHQKRVEGYQTVLKFGFFAVKIPFAVYSVVGPFDESFGVGGGEDSDYCVRCYKLGFELRFALSSYLLHFTGKSTWRGPETTEQTETRNQIYRERFKSKWGRGLLLLMMDNDLSGLPPDSIETLQKGDFRGFIEECTRGRSL